MIYSSIIDLIGNTPLVRFDKLAIQENITSVNILAKIESFNPAGSVKDRVGYAMIKDAIKNGTLHPGGTIVEPTSGNTGIAIAAVAAAMGFKAIIVMPETMSIERRQMISAYGAKLVLTEGKLGTTGAITEAERLLKENPSYVRLGQFDNSSNPKMHEQTTGPEIWKDTEGKVDILIAGVGTGGTLSGAGAYLKKQNPNIKVIAVEPTDSAVLSGEPAGPHAIQGIGAGFIPKNLNTKIYNEIIKITNEEALKYGAMVASTEGMLVGISSGAAIAAAIKVAKREENKNKNIVVVLPDNGDRYFSTALFANK